jgi:lauroyl/myristoyl acyltransferase
MYILIALYSWLLAKLPEIFARLNAWLLGQFIWLLRRKIILPNLEHAFPDKNESWYKKIGKLSCQRTAEMSLFGIASPNISEKEIRSRVKINSSIINGPSRLNDSTKGTVCFVPHFSLMEMMTTIKLMDASLAQRDWVTLYRPLDLPAAEKWIKESRERFGMRLVSRKEGFGQTMETVRQGGIAAILFDQNTHGGVPVKFLNRTCAVTNLPGMIVQRFSAEARIFWARRTGFWRCELNSCALNSSNATELTEESNQWLAEQLKSSDEHLCRLALGTPNRWKIAINSTTEERVDCPRVEDAGGRLSPAGGRRRFRTITVFIFVVILILVLRFSLRNESSVNQRRTYLIIYEYTADALQVKVLRN